MSVSVPARPPACRRTSASPAPRVRSPCPAHPSVACGPPPHRVAPQHPSAQLREPAGPSATRLPAPPLTSARLAATAALKFRLPHSARDVGYFVFRVCMSAFLYLYISEIQLDLEFVFLCLVRIEMFRKICQIHISDGLPSYRPRKFRVLYSPL